MRNRFIVKFCPRDFYDRTPDGFYDKQAPDNISGLNDNEKWDSMALLVKTIRLNKGKRAPMFMRKRADVVKVIFRSKKKAERLHKAVMEDDWLRGIIETTEIKTCKPRCPGENPRRILIDN